MTLWIKIRYKDFDGIDKGYTCATCKTKDEYLQRLNDLGITIDMIVDLKIAKKGEKDLRSYPVKILE